MKSLLRSSAVQGMLAWSIWAWMALIGRTTRWTIEGADEIRDAWESPRGMIAAAWHSRILLLPAGWTRVTRSWKQHGGALAILVSHSPDGAFVAGASQRLGLQVIRGSSGNRQKKAKNKGGAAAIAQVSRLLREGGVCCMTVDGPRGPMQRASLGAVLLAQKLNVPLMIYAQASSPAFRLKTWDRFLVPLPFGKGALVFDGVVEAPRDVPPETIRLELEARLNSATRRAEALVGLSHLEPAPLATIPSADAPT